eukprot:TRINITY_DN3574_c0_g1_i1.p1 TRINITY_DN3574_c0_g1~~TRINITY_DN3574_c0_g1_i1.p1  ORF type:complete len:174 (-),score=48.09 TRINITY_DN3574_c0_g1_i1:189-710(-)
MRGTIHDPLDGQTAETIAEKQARPLQLFAEQNRREAEERRAKRTAEGGRGGGFNDRQDVEYRASKDAEQGEYDDFGRRVKHRGADGAAGAGGGATPATTKAERAAAALARLRDKGKQPTSRSDAAARRGDRSRSRSRSGSRERLARASRGSGREAASRAPDASFRPRGANCRF